MKEQFLKDMAIVCPQGFEHSSQLKSRIVFYYTGYVAALKVTGQIEEVWKITKEYSFLCDPAWQPDDSWKWWQPCTSNLN